MKPLKIKGCDVVRFSPDGASLACFARDVGVWHLASRKKRLKCHPLSHPASICFSPDGSRLAVKNTSGRIVIINVEDGSILSDFRNGKDGEGSNLLYSICGEYLIDGTWNGRLFVRRSDSGRVEFRQDFRHEMIRAVHSANQGAVWVINHGPKATSDTDPPPPAHFSIWQWPFEKNSFATFSQGSPFVRRSALTSDGRFLALVYGTKVMTLAVYDMEKGKEIASSTVETGGTGSALNWSGDGAYLGSVQAHKVTVYSADRLTKVFEYPLPYASHIAFSPLNDLVAIGSWQGGVVMAMDAVTGLNPVTA